MPANTLPKLYESTLVTRFGVGRGVLVGVLVTVPVGVMVGSRPLVGVGVDVMGVGVRVAVGMDED